MVSVAMFMIGLEAIKQIKCGVPRGLILGPLLFIIYKNDISNFSSILYTILYVDDTYPVLSGNDLPDLIKYNIQNSVNFQFF